MFRLVERRSVWALRGVAYSKPGSTTIHATATRLYATGEFSQRSGGLGRAAKHSRTSRQDAMGNDYMQYNAL